MTRRCHHCGEPATADAFLRVDADGAQRAFCCAGCAAAADWIAQAGLDDYYRLRTADGARVQAGRGNDYASWDRPEILREHVVERDGACEATVLVEGMRCAACAWLIDRALAREPGVAEVSANAITGRVRLRFDRERIGLGRLMSRLAALGYRPWLAGSHAQEDRRARERRTWLLRLGVAGLGAMQAMMFAEALYLDTAGEMPVATRDFLRWVTFLVSTPVVFFSGWPFLSGMARELRSRRPGMDTLVGSAVLLAYGASLYGTFVGAEHVWYDAAVMFVLLLLVARWFEHAARQRAGAQVDALARARPALAMRERDDSTTESVPSSLLQPGDVVHVAVGDALPADGTLLDDAAELSEALLTGEPRPVPHAAGDAVLAGSIACASRLRVRVLRTGGDTWVSQLARLVERAQASRPRIARLAERVASAFVVALLIAAAGVYAAWSFAAPERALEITLAVLVVSCPCALSLAIPAALAAAHGALARIGVLAVAPDALETLARADVALFDKTGTLTRGRPQLVAVDTVDGSDPAAALRIAAALERGSLHPIAAAFAHVDAPPATHVRAHAGVGVEGSLDGRHYRLGHAAFAAVDTLVDGLWLGESGRAIARFTLEDTMRDDARSALDALRAQDIDIGIASGDAREDVLAVARRLGVAAPAWRQSPGDKLARVRALQRDGHVVLMVGDGINDAPVLAGADVSIALAGGAPMAHRAADLVVHNDALCRIPQAVALARRTRRIVRQNLAWAIGYNVLALPFAALGWVPPWLAAIGMSASSLVVTLNALRLARAPRDDATTEAEAALARTLQEVAG